MTLRTLWGRRETSHADSPLPMSLLVFNFTEMWLNTEAILNEHLLIQLPALFPIPMRWQVLQMAETILTSCYCWKHCPHFHAGAAPSLAQPMDIWGPFMIQFRPLNWQKNTSFSCFYFAALFFCQFNVLACWKYMKGRQCAISPAHSKPSDIAFPSWSLWLYCRVDSTFGCLGQHTWLHSLWPYPI